MHQKLAKKLFLEGAVFFFLDVPEGTEFGIDLKSWNTGEKFRGVKMIPPGVHYIFYSSVSNTGDIAPRTGFFHVFKKGEILVKKWDLNSEDISETSVSSEQMTSFRENLTTFDQFLGPYPYDIHNKWKNLTVNISENLLQKIMPTTGLIKSALELEPLKTNNTPEKSNRTSTSSINKILCDLSDDSLLPQLKAKSGTEIRFTNFPDKHYPDNATHSEITQHSLDTSYVFNYMVNQYEQPTDFIGELEFCFICFLVGHSLEAFEQWKKLISLFSTSENAILKHRRIFNLLVNDLQIQIFEVPEEFLADIVSNNNFLYMKLRTLFRNVISSADDDLKCKVKKLMETLSSKYFWDFEHLESDDEEDAPVVVHDV